MEMSSLEKIKEMLGSIVRVVIDDDRIIEGEFQCVDRGMNLVVANATEYHRMLKSKDPISFVEGPRTDFPLRQLGMAIIPGKHIVGILVDMET